MAPLACQTIAEVEALPDVGDALVEAKLLVNRCLMGLRGGRWDRPICGFDRWVTDMWVVNNRTWRGVNCLRSTGQECVSHD